MGKSRNLVDVILKEMHKDFCSDTEQIGQALKILAVFSSQGLAVVMKSQGRAE